MLTAFDPTGRRRCVELRVSCGVPERAAGWRNVVPATASELWGLQGALHRTGVAACPAQDAGSGKTVCVFKRPTAGAAGTASPVSPASATLQAHCMVRPAAHSTQHCLPLSMGQHERHAGAQRQAHSVRCCDVAQQATSRPGPPVLTVRCRGCPVVPKGMPFKSADASVPRTTPCPVPVRRPGRAHLPWQRCRGMWQAYLWGLPRASAQSSAD